MDRALTRLLTADTVALGRAGLGAVLLARPAAVPQLLGVDSAAATRMGWSTQMLGIREVTLGLGTFVALRRSDARAARLWLLAGLVTDSVDLLAVGAATARGRLSKTGGLGLAGLAGGAVYAGIEALRGTPEPVR